jgi:hypothetical protein
MFYAINWFVSMALLALWSLLCWGLHAAAVWAMSSAGALAAGASAAHAALLPAWLQGWIPPELAQAIEGWVAAAGPWVQSLLDTVPALAGTVTVLAWAVWGLGAVVLVLMALGIHMLISLLKRQTVQYSKVTGRTTRPDLKLRQS